LNFDIQDLTGTFSVGDIAIALSLAFVLSAAIGWVYRATHRNVSYSQSYVQTLVMLGMIISLIMLVVGSNIARAFALVGRVVGHPVPQRHQGDPRRRVHLPRHGHRHGLRDAVLPARDRGHRWRSASPPW
jgi:hypothetical protein